MLKEIKAKAKEAKTFDDPRSDMADKEEAQSEDQRSDLGDMEETKKFVAFVLDKLTRVAVTVDILYTIEKINGTAVTEEEAATAIKLEENAFSLTIASAQSASVYEDYKKREDDICRVYRKETEQIISDLKNNQSVVNATSVSSPPEDRPVPSVTWRWTVAIALFGYFVLRICYLRHSVVVCLIFGMLVIGQFLSVMLIRHYPEFEFWEHVMFCLCICIPITFVDFFGDLWLPLCLGWVLLSYAFLRNPFDQVQICTFNIRIPMYGKKPAR